MLSKVSSIDLIYPDIEGQLENRHSALYGRLKSKFSKLYCDLDPDHFVSVKGIARMFRIDNTDLGIEFALENGVVMAIKPIQEQQSIFINTNQHTQDQIELSAQGHILDNHCELAEWLSIGAQAALLSQPDITSPCGAIIFIKNIIPRDAFQCREALISSMFLAILAINKVETGFVLSKMEESISKICNGLTIPPYFMFKNYHFTHTSLLNHQQLQIEKHSANWKLLVADVLHSEVETKRLMTVRAVQAMEQAFAEILVFKALNIQQKGPIFELLDRLQIDLNELVEIVMKFVPEQIERSVCQKMLGFLFDFDPRVVKLHPRKHLLTIIHQFRLVHDFTQPISATNLAPVLKEWYELQKQQQLISTQVDQLVNYCIKNGALACSLIHDRFLLVLCEKKNCLGIFNLLKAKNFQGPNGEELFEGIQHLIFSTLPSTGAAILDPRSELWF